VCAAGVFLESTTEFTVDARSVVPRGGRVKAFVTAPTGTRTEALVNNNNDGTYKCMYTPYEQGMLPACVSNSNKNYYNNNNTDLSGVRCFNSTLYLIHRYVHMLMSRGKKRVFGWCVIVSVQQKEYSTISG